MNALIVGFTPTLIALLAVLSLVGALPSLLRAQHAVAVPPAGPGVGRVPVILVRTVTGRWFADGRPVDPLTLERRLAARGASLAIRFLPSTQLSVAEVSASLAWLRQRTAGSVQLELRGDAR